MTCPICRETHAPDARLSYDGKGINDCGSYRRRLATMTTDCPRDLARMMAAAPQLAALLSEAVIAVRSGDFEEYGTTGDFYREAVAALKAAGVEI
jgi:hypothetical protein